MADPGQNDAAAYGVQIHHNAGAVMRCIGVHHLTATENKGNHHIYLDILDEDGQRLDGAVALYTWQGRAGDPLRIICDKPADEPAANIPMWPGQIITLWVDTGAVVGASDQVSGLHTAHPDEEGGNTRFHHSFYVVFQLRRNALVPQPPEHAAPQPEIPERPIPLADVLPDLLTRLVRIQEDARAIMETLQGL
ncbi:MAG: hypothetical protein ACUVSF_14005 [Anaerolineae bacterium]